MFAILFVCRFAHYAAAMMLFGSSIFVWVLAPAPLTVRLDTSAARLSSVAIPVVLATAAVLLMLEAGTMGDGWQDAFRPDTVLAVLTGTNFGKAWQVHGLACLCLLAAWLAGLPRVTCGASGVVLASLGLVGHAAMHSDPVGWLHRASLSLHLISGGFWLGGLVPLLAALRLAAQPTLSAASILALRRFSIIGHGAVAAVILTGGFNTILILGVNGVVGAATTYRAMLFAKVALVAVMVGLAMLNRYWLVPRLRRSDQTAVAIARNSCFELVLGGIAIALVSAFGMLNPYA